MHNGNENTPTADEITAAVRHLVERNRTLLAERDELEAELGAAVTDLDDLRRQFGEQLVIRRMNLPSGHRWAFIEDCQVLAISTDIDAETESLLLGQVQPPRLIACNVCGAPFWSNSSCTPH